jgi:hypothetical protein
MGWTSIPELSELPKLAKADDGTGLPILTDAARAALAGKEQK